MIRPLLLGLLCAPAFAAPAIKEGKPTPITATNVQKLKNTLEVRACDSLPASLAMAVPALFTGLLYDARALGQSLRAIRAGCIGVSAKEKAARRAAVR